jgi:cobalt/nickel transport system permease protein
MPFAQLLVTLRRLRVPAVFVAILAFMYRYVFVIWDELDRLRTARKARSMGRTSLLFRWKSLAAMLGMLLIRSLTRAERIHGAMVSRGWTGEVHWLDDED